MVMSSTSCPSGTVMMTDLTMASRSHPSARQLWHFPECTALAKEVDKGEQRDRM